MARANGLATKIKDFISSQIAENARISSLLSQSQAINYTVDKIKEKYNKRLLEFVESEKSARINEEIIMKKNNREHLIGARIQENLEELRKKNEEKLSKQKAKLKSLVLERKLHEESVMERINKSSFSPRRIFTTDKVKRTVNIVNTSQDNEIDKKLEELNRKLLRSSENYAKNIQGKIESIQGNRKRRNSLNDHGEYEGKLKSISQKHENAFSRRQKIMNEFHDKILMRGNKEAEKIEKIQGLAELEIEKIDKQNKSIEEKDEKIVSFLLEIKKKKKNKVKELREKKKTAETELHEKIFRMKKQEEHKKEKILEKHLEIERKKKEHNEYLETVNKQIREKAMNFTIEKEKLKVFKSLISKSQSPEEVKKLLEKYQLQATQK